MTATKVDEIVPESGARVIGEFFHGWRRKTGCATLIMALALMVAWIRCGIVVDIVKLSPSPHESVHYLISADGSFQWKRREIIGGYPAATWSSENLASKPELNLYADTESKRSWTVPYCCIVIPLTLCSAWLLLPKSRNWENHHA